MSPVRRRLRRVRPGRRERNQVFHDRQSGSGESTLHRRMLAHKVQAGEKDRVGVVIRKRLRRRSRGSFRIGSVIFIVVMMVTEPVRVSMFGTGQIDVKMRTEIVTYRLAAPVSMAERSCLDQQQAGQQQ